MNELLLYVEILLPALIAGLLILLTHIPLGAKVLAKGIIFFDLAIAQLAAFGVVLSALLLDSAQEKWLTQSRAVCTALLGACFLYYLRTFSVKFQEAVIGIIFLLSSTGELLVLTKDPQAHDTFQQLMLGQILWVGYQDIAYLIVFTALIAFLWAVIKRWNEEMAFYVAFALAVTMSTQFIGVYLVFASLIIPALGSQKASKPWLTASFIGVSSYVMGLLLSALFDLPSGALISWCMVMMCGVCLSTKCIRLSLKS